MGFQQTINIPEEASRHHETISKSYSLSFLIQECPAIAQLNICVYSANHHYSGIVNKLSTDFIFQYAILDVFNKGVCIGVADHESWVERVNQD